MCLIFLAFRVKDDDPVPVKLAANREEWRRRPSTPPVCLERGSIRCLLAGADHGPDGSFPEIGTWLGVNEQGLVVAVTNRQDGELAWADQVRSRGLLAVTLLGCSEPEQAVRLACDELAGGGFGGCNYLIVNRRSAFVVQASGARRIAIEPLPPGVHAMTNLDVNDPGDPRIRFVREHLVPEWFLASAQGICRDERIIVDAPERGTVSSSLVLVGDAIQFYHRLGDPRDGAFEAIRPFCQ
jgi:uncharacterized protein with NRDE domain